MNLGWKLAATVHGWAPDGLLDTYSAERHPIGAWVLEWTRSQVALMRPESHTRALRAVLAELTGTVTSATFFAKKISGVWQRYDLPGDHPLIGRNAPDLELSDGSRLADHLRGGLPRPREHAGRVGRRAPPVVRDAARSSCLTSGCTVERRTAAQRPPCALRPTLVRPRSAPAVSRTPLCGASFGP